MSDDIYKFRAKAFQDYSDNSDDDHNGTEKASFIEGLLKKRGKPPKKKPRKYKTSSKDVIDLDDSDSDPPQIQENNSIYHVFHSLVDLS